MVNFMAKLLVFLNGLAYLDNLDPDQTSDLQEVTITRDTKQECNRIEEITKDKLERQVVLAWSDIDVSSPPCKETINETNKCDDAEQSGNDHTSNLDTYIRR
jgi:hypothetical protein